MRIDSGLIRRYRKSEKRIRLSRPVCMWAALFAVSLACWSLCAVTVSAQPSTVCCPDTIIRFDDLPPNVSVTTHYHAQGVDFGLPPYATLLPSSQIPLGMAC